MKEMEEGERIETSRMRGSEKRKDVISCREQLAPEGF